MKNIFSKLFASITLFIFPTICFGQISQNEIPTSFLSNVVPVQDVTTKTIQKPDLELIAAEDLVLEAEGNIPNIGRLLPLNISPKNSGEWAVLHNGDRIWRIKVKSEGAKGLNFYFNNFHIPEGGKLFIYSQDKYEVLGAFTAENNTVSGRFATDFIHGEVAVIEYYEPALQKGKGILEIAELGYAYRFVEARDNRKSFGDAASCHVNVGCPEGDLWTDTRKSVVRILLRNRDNIGWCSGSVINNTRYDFTPYFLTAMHCGMNDFSKRLIPQEDFDQWIFFFNYEIDGCQGAFTEGDLPRNTMVGATPVSHSNDKGGEEGSDFLLLELKEQIPIEYEPVFAGWDISEMPSRSGVSIHHPQGDAKKISTYNTPLESGTFGDEVDDTHWKVIWTQTENGKGATEPGSSGSPIFNLGGQIVGTLTGGNASCDKDGRPDYYGKMSYHWESNIVPDDPREEDDGPDRGLKAWLDPISSGVQWISSINYSGNIITGVTSTEKEIFDFELFPNPAQNQIQIDLKNINPNKPVGVKILNYQGQLILGNTFSEGINGEILMDISELQKGFYILELEAGNEIPLIKKFIKE
ncbi:T9SS type A sorting domain-containing protein [Flexithrix dorotheae]|uniref:T9SS type A sorting domain-containing protein n=1 Tax=Flexithrix dorotheae TaxID=70993 RepID=UPI00037C820D|nr:T9SS type A sorting domain-containing protein [Flexithrix dorotheae]